MYTITVTSADTVNQPGTLPWALETLLAYEGEESVCLVFELPEGESALTSTTALTLPAGTFLRGDGTTSLTFAQRLTADGLLLDGVQVTLRNYYNHLLSNVTISHGSMDVVVSGGKSSVLRGDLSIGEGGTLILRAADALGWGDTAPTTLSLKGSEEEGATLRLAARQTLKTDIRLLGYSTITATDAPLSGANTPGFDPLDGGIYAEGVGNTINVRLQTRWDFRLEVAAGGELLVNGMVTDTASSNFGDGLYIKEGEGTIIFTQTGNLFRRYTQTAGNSVFRGESQIFRDIVTIEGGIFTVEKSAEFRDVLHLQGGELHSEGSLTFSSTGAADFNGAGTLCDGTLSGKATLTAEGLSSNGATFSGGTFTITDALTITGLQLAEDGTLELSEGSALNMSGCTLLGTLRLSLGADTTALKGNNFENTTIILQDLESGGTVDLSGNDWGTTDKEEISEMLGLYAYYITMDGERLSETDSPEVHVTNTKDSGRGSLRWAVEQVNTYTGEAPIRIVIAESLAGQTLTLSSPLLLSHGAVIIGPDGGFNITGAAFASEAETELHHLALQQLELRGEAVYRGEDVTLTSTAPLQLTTFTGTADYTGTSAPAAECALISGMLTAASASAYPLSGRVLRLSGNTNIAAGDEIELHPGMLIDLEGFTLNIFGKLHAVNEESIDVLANEGGGNVYVKDGGLLSLENSYFNLSSDGVLSGRLQIDGGGTLVCRQSNIHAALLALYGKADLCDTYVRCTNSTLYSNGELAAEQTRFANALTLNSGSKADINNSTFYSDLTAYGTLNLTGSIVEGALQVNNADLISGSGNTIKGETAYRFTDFSGDAASVLGLAVTTAENAHAEVKGSLGDSTFAGDAERLPGGYCQTGSVVIYAGYTVNICDGAVWHCTETIQDLNTSGTLNISDATLILAAVSNTDRSSIRANSGSTVTITRSTVQGGGSGKVVDYENNIHIESGAVVTITDSVLSDLDGIQTYSGGTLSIDHCEVTSPRITVADGATLSLSNTTFTGELSLSMEADIKKLSGNDFSHATLVLRDMAPGRTIDLSGNDWGTTDRERLTELFGLYAPYIVIDGERLATEEVVELHVTNADNDGENSFRWALAQANAYTGAEVVRITVDDALSGQTIELQSALTLNNAATIIGPADGITLSGATLNVTAPLTLSRITLPQISLSGSGTLIAEEGVVFTGSAPVNIASYYGWSGTLDLRKATATAANASVRLSGTISGTSHFCKLPPSFSGGYVLSGSLSIARGKTVTMEQGVQWDLEGRELRVSGTLIAENDTLTSVFSNVGYGYVIVRNGGTVRLTRSSIMIADAARNPRGQVIVEAGGALYIEDAELRTAELQVHGQVTLLNTDVHSLNPTIVSDRGKLCATNAAFDYTIQGANGSTLELENCTLNTYLTAYGTAKLNGVSATELYVSGTTKMLDTENGISLTEQRAFTLCDWAGDTKAFFDSFTWNCTHENWYVGLTGGMKTSIFHADLSGRKASYKVSGPLSVNSKSIVTLEEGAQWDISGYYVNIYGTLQAHFTEKATAFSIGSNMGGGFSINNQGILSLENADIAVSDLSSRGYEHVYVNQGGTLLMKKSALRCTGSLEISAEGTAELIQCDVMCSITSAGNLTLTNSEVTSFVNTTGHAVITGSLVESYISSTAGSLVLQDSTVHGWVRIGSRAELNNVSMNELDISGYARLNVGRDGITLKGQKAFTLRDWAGDTDVFFSSFAWRATASGWYVALIGTMGDATFRSTIAEDDAEYRLSGTLTIRAQRTVTLKENTCWDLNGYTLNIEGDLVAQNEEHTTVLRASGYGYINVRTGGTLRLTASDVNMADSSGRLRGGMYVTAGGALIVNSSDLTFAEFSTYGYTELHDVRVTGSDRLIAYAAAQLYATDTVFSASVRAESASRLSLSNCTIGGYLAAYGKTSLDNITASELSVSAGTALQVGSGGITLTGQKAFSLISWAGDTDTFFSSFEWVATADNWYVGLGGSMGNATFGNRIKDITAHYMLTEELTIGREKTVTLSERTVWDCNGYNIIVNGTLIAENEDDILLFPNIAYLHIQNGGLAKFSHSQIGDTGNTNSWRGCVYIYNGGNLLVEGGELGVSELWCYGEAKLSDMAVHSNVFLHSGGTLRATNTNFDYRVESNNGSTIILEDCNLSSYLAAYSRVQLNRVSMTELAVSSQTQLQVGDGGITLTGELAFTLRNWEGDTDVFFSSFTWQATNENWYIGIDGSLGNSVFRNRILTEPARYRLIGSVSINSGQTTRLDKGVQWDMRGNALYVYGTLLAENDVYTSVLTQTAYGAVYIRNGGTLELTRSGIDFEDSSGTLRGSLQLYNNAQLHTESAEIKVADFSVSGQAELSNTLVRCANATAVYNGARLTATNSTFESTVRGEAGSTIELEACTITNYVESSGTLVLSDCTLNSYLAVYNTAQLTRVTATEMVLSAATKLQLGEEGITLTGERAFTLRNWAGDTDEFFSSFTWQATHPHWYVGLTGSLDDATFHAAIQGHETTYKLNGALTVNRERTVTLEEGTQWETGANYLYVYGTLQAHYADNATVLTLGGLNSSAYIRIYDRGVLSLRNANIDTASGSNNRIYISGGGTLQMTMGYVRCTGGIELQSRATAEFTSVSVRNAITGYGNLTLLDSDVSDSVLLQSGSVSLLDGSTFNSAVTIRSGATVDMGNSTFKGKVSLSLGASYSHLSGNDFSEASITLTDTSAGRVIDLSGNYWGTTDIDAIIAKIQNYSEERVLINSILSEPPVQAFTFDASQIGRHNLAADTTSLVLSFTREVDAATVTPESIRLVGNHGTEANITNMEVNGREVTLYFSALHDGIYRVQVANSVRDIRGNAFTSAGSTGINYVCTPLELPQVILFRSNSTVTDRFSYVDLFFDQQMNSATLNNNSIHITDEAGNELHINRIYEAGVMGNTFYRVMFDTATTQGTYCVRVDDTAESKVGVRLSGGYTHHVYISSPDLTVQDDVNLTDTRLGRYTTISYTITNTGDGDIAETSWTDAVYLCRSEQWDESQATLFGRVTQNHRSLAANGSYTASVRGLLTDLEAGTYYVFVKTDESARVNEANESNNISATGTCIEIAPVEHPLGEHTEKLLSANERLYYKFTAADDMGMVFSFDNTRVSIYVCEEGAEPTAATNLASCYTTLSQTVACIPTEAGKRYTVMVNPAGAGSYHSELTGNRFMLLNTTSSVLAAGRPGTLTVYGTGFGNDSSFYLLAEDGTHISPIGVTVLSPVAATLTFDIPEGAGIGSALVLAGKAHAEDEEVRLEMPLSVATYADALQLNFRKGMNGWQYTRVGYAWKTELTVSNQSAANVRNAIILITDTADDFALYYSYEDANVRDRSALLLMSGTADSTKDILTAGETETLNLYIKQYRSGTGAIQAFVLSPDDDALITEQQWDAFESALRPASVGSAEWSAWWGDMRSRIGTTVGDFTQFIYSMQEISLAAGANTGAPLNMLVEDIIHNHADYKPNYYLEGIITDSDGHSPKADTLVTLYRVQGDKRIFVRNTLTDENGYYRFLAADNAEYVISLPGDFADFDQDGEIDDSAPIVCINGGDIQVNPVIIEKPSSLGAYEYLSEFAAASADSVGRVYFKNDTLIFSEYRNGQWCPAFGIAEGDISDYELAWNERLQSYIVSWSVNGDENAFYMMLITPEADGHVCYHPVLVYQGDETVQILQLDDGENMLITHDKEGRTSYSLLPLQDDYFHQDAQIIRKEEDIETSGTTANLSVKWESSIVIPVLKWKADIEFKVSDSLTSSTCSASETVRVDGGFSTNSIRTGPYVNDSLTISFSSSETDTYKYTDEGKREHNESFSANLNVDYNSPQALITILKNIPVTAFIGNALWKLKNKLSKSFHITLLAGVHVAFDATISSESKDNGSTLGSGNGGNGSENTVTLSPTIEMVLGLANKKNFEVSLSGSVSGSVTFSIGGLLDWSLESTSLSAELSGALNIPIPLFGTFKGEFKWSTETTVRAAAPSDDIIFTVEEVPRYCLCQTVKHGAELYTISTDENSEGYGGLRIEVRRSDNTIESLDLSSSGLQGGGPLAQGRGYITDLQCTDTANGVMITLDGYYNLPKIAKDKFYDMEEVAQIYDVLRYNKSREVILLQGSQLIPISRKDIPYNDDSIILPLSSGESYQIDTISSPLDSGERNYVTVNNINSIEGATPEIIFDTDATITGITANNIGGTPVIQFNLDHSTDGTDRYETVYMAENNGQWERIYISTEPEQSPAYTAGPVLSLAASVLQRPDPWALLTQCPNKPEPDDELPHEDFQSYDPNDIVGPQGYGTQNWVARQEMHFMVECENEAENNIAHAAMVTITQHIDEAFDYASFRLGDMMIAGQYIEVKGAVQSYKARLDWRSTLGVWVDVNAFFDADTGDVRWEFIALDPETMMAVADPFKGLLAPNFTSPEGEGAVYYYITPKASAASGTVIKAEASIVFDFNEAIATPTLNYTLDVDAPVATINTMATSNTERYLHVSWSGQDIGSGIAGYNIYVSTDHGAWVLWQENITATSALFRVAEGEHNYFFMAQGVDHAGNAEQMGDMVAPEAGTISTYAEEELHISSVSAGQAGGIISFAITFASEVSCNDWEQALRVTAGETMLDLSLGTLSYDAERRTLSWQGDAQGIADGQKLQFLVTPGAVCNAGGDAYAGTLSFGAAVELTAKGSAYAAPTLYDYNGDGLSDLIVGEMESEGGRVRLYLNEGTAEEAIFSTFTYATTGEDTVLTVEAEGCQGAIIRFADLTGNGTDEMLIGLADGSVRVFTAAEGGHWADAGLLACSVGGKEATVNVGERAAIEFTDFNSDGRMDLLIGTGGGNIVLYLNTADSGIRLDGGQYLHDCNGRISLGSRVSVTAGDFDGDTVNDLVVADATGSILFYRNEGSNDTPLFGEPVRVLLGDSAADLSAETTRIRLDAADLNNDGRLDLAAGLSDGRVLAFYGTEDTLLLGTAHAGTIPLPDAPQHLELSAKGSMLYLNWGAAEGDVITYEISIQATGSSEAEVQTSRSNTWVTSLPDGHYTVQVRALNQGHAGAWCAPQSVTIDTIAPDAPTDSSFAHTENGISLSWAAVNDADGYELRYRIAGTETWRTISVTETQVDITLSANGLYEWQVRATDAAGNSSAWLSGNAFTIGHITTDTVEHWAAGLRFDTAGTLIGGYYDVNKSGSEDSELCWAAADANVLAWWQSNSVSGSVLNGVPNTAESIYATFTENWANTSGADVYGFIWWLSGTAASDTYTAYYNRNYTGDSALGGYYSRYYKPESIAESTAQVSLKGSDATAENAAWADIYDKGGMLTLGVFRSVSGGNLSGGHSLTLWGYTADAETGHLTELLVTDSDDGKTGITTLSVAYNADTGFYHITGGSNTLAGYVLGTYTYLTAFANLPVVTLGTESAVKNADGTAQVTFRWSAESPAVYVLSVNGKDYNLRGATSYTLTLPESVREYTLTATNAEGNSITLNGTLLYDSKPAHATDIALTDAETGLVTPDGRVTDTIGGGDAQDYYRFTATEDGTYAIGTDITTPGGSFLLSLGAADAAGDYVVQRSLTTGAGSTNAIEGISLRKGETAYIRISSESAEESAYELRVAGEIPAAASITDNNTAETVDALVGSTAPAAVQGWVGAGDACDFYRLQLAEASSLQLSLSGVDTAARVKVYAEQSDGSRALLSAGTATAVSGLDRTLALTAGSYFIEVAALNPDNGLSNSSYTLELKEQKGKRNTHYVLATR